MAKFYTSGGGGGAAPSASGPSFTGYSGASAGAASSPAAAASAGAGKFNLGVPDLSSPGSAIGDIAGGIGSLIGGVTGAVGQIGIPGGPNLGDVGTVVGAPVGAALGGVDEVLKAVGGIGLPDLGPLIGREGNAPAHIGDIIPKMVEVVGTPVKAIERTVAGQRAEARVGLSAADLHDLESGMSVSEVADRMVARGAGFIDNPWLNLGGQILFDPVNWISLGAGGALHEAASAGSKAVIAADAAGVGERVGNRMFSVLANGAPEKALAEADRLAGHVATGVFDSIGSAAFNKVTSAANKLNPAYGDALERALSVGAAQYGPQVIARRLGIDFENATRGVAQAGTEDLRRAYGDALIADAKGLRKDVEGMADNLAPTFLDNTAAANSAEAAKMVSRVTGMPEDVSAQFVRDTFGETLSIEEMRTLDLMDYGHAIHGLDEAHAAFTGPELRAFQGANDLTVMARDTLSHDDATGLRDAIAALPERLPRAARRKAGEPPRPKGQNVLDRVAHDIARMDQRRAAVKAAEDAVQRFSRFADIRHLRGKAAVDAVRDRVDALLAGDVLPHGIEPKAATAADPFGNVPIAKVLPGPELDAYVAIDKEVAKAERAWIGKNPGKKLADAKDNAAKHIQKLHRDREAAAAKIKREPVPTAEQNIQAAYDAGNVEKGQKLNVAAGVAKGGTAASGGAVKAESTLPKALREFIASQADGGYRVGFVPKGDAMVRTLPDGTEMFIRPFARTASDVPMIRPNNPIQSLFRGATRQITTAKIINSARIRMAKAITATPTEVRMTEHESNQFFRAVLGEARATGMTPRALPQGGLNKYDELARQAWGNGRYESFKAAGGDPTAMIMHAFAGNWREVGLTQKATGYLKSTFPRALPKIAEDMYPAWRFGKASPGFQWQEVIESPFFSGMRGLRPVRGEGARDAVFKQAQEMYKGILDRTDSMMGASARVAGEQDARKVAENGVKLFDDAGGILQFAAEESVGRGFGTGTKLGRLTSRFSPKNVIRGKDANMFKQVISEHPELFKEALDQSFGPRYWKVMEETYGTKDIGEITKAFIGERVAFAKGGEEWARVVDSGRSAFMADVVKSGEGFTSADMETVWQAYRTTAIRAAAVAQRTHYFQTGRSFLERTINHPFLGIYPASYMAKVAREYARFLLVRPFGLKAPLAGYEAVAHVQRAIVVQMQNDPEFANFMESNKAAIYLMNLMLPGLPNELPANAPAVLRHVAENQIAGKPFSPAQVVKDLPTDAFSHMGIGRDVTATFQAGQDVVPDLFGTLDTATKAIQGIFGGGAPSP